MPPHSDRRQYLDRPFLVEILTLEHAQALLRPLARDGHSALPCRLRTRCARLHRELTALLREVRTRPGALRHEADCEEAP